MINRFCSRGHTDRRASLYGSEEGVTLLITMLALFIIALTGVVVVQVAPVLAALSLTSLENSLKNSGYVWPMSVSTISSSNQLAPVKTTSVRTGSSLAAEAALAVSRIRACSMMKWRRVSSAER